MARSKGGKSVVEYGVIALIGGAIALGGGGSVVRSLSSAAACVGAAMDAASSCEEAPVSDFDGSGPASAQAPAHRVVAPAPAPRRVVERLSTPAEEQSTEPSTDRDKPDDPARQQGPGTSAEHRPVRAGEPDARERSNEHKNHAADTDEDEPRGKGAGSGKAKGAR